MSSTNVIYIPESKADTRVVISGGGTGGHIYPALSIAEAIRRRQPDADILFVGAQGRMEMEKVPAAGYQIIGLPVRGLDRRRLWRNIPIIIDYLKAKAKCRKIIKKFKPLVVIGVGGYASAPMLKAAQRAGVKTIIQEQNSYAGVTNKMLAKGADYIGVAYKNMERFFPAERIHLTGNPIREAIANCELTPSQARDALGFDSKKPLLLVVGGSLGARTINQSMERWLGDLSALGLSILWQTGRNWPEVDPVSLPSGVKVVRFIDDMAKAYRAATYVVARAGACTISEIQLLGKTSILIPSPNVAEDHQRHNAEALVNEGAALMILDREATDKLYETVRQLVDNPELCTKIGEAARSMALTGSADIIAAEALKR